MDLRPRATKYPLRIALHTSCNLSRIAVSGSICLILRQARSISASSPPPRPGEASSIEATKEHPVKSPPHHQKKMPPTTTPMSSLLTTSLRPSCPSCRLTTQIRHASLLRRPKRPYTFTQMITLSDGSTYLHRTTSPAPIYRSTKDTKNNPLWNPSSQKLKNVEEDEAGRLKRFRGRFGRGWDAEVVTEVEEVSFSSHWVLLFLAGMEC